MVSLLIQSGADPNIGDVDDNTAFDHARILGNSDIYHSLKPLTDCTRTKCGFCQNLCKSCDGTTLNSCKSSISTKTNLNSYPVLVYRPYHYFFQHPSMIPSTYGRPLLLPYPHLGWRWILFLNQKISTNKIQKSPFQGWSGDSCNFIDLGDCVIT